jgi:hypothetical protein
MSLLSTFCTNSINILAGINGLEVSQALVIAFSVVINDLLYLPWPFTLHLGGETKVGGVYGAGLAYGSRELVDRHLLSLYFMLPLIGVCLAFLYHNWFVRLFCVCSSTNVYWKQVPSPRIPWGHALLLHRNDVCRRRHLGPFQQNPAPVFHAADIQFPAELSAAVWTGAVSPASCASVCLPSRNARRQNDVGTWLLGSTLKLSSCYRPWFISRKHPPPCHPQHSSFFHAFI